MTRTVLMLTLAAIQRPIAQAYTRKLDDMSAITALEKALALEPENGPVQRQLLQLKRFQRR